MSGLDYINRIIAAVGEKKVLRNEEMSRHTTFRIGGPADCLVQPENAEELREILRICREEDVPYFILGNGSNLLVSDSGYRGLIIQLFRNMSGIEIDGDIITAQTGSLLTQIASAAAGAELTGFEFASGIPGTLGGLTVEGFMLSPDFRPDRREYVVYLPFEQSSLDVSAYAAAEGDIISVSGTEGLKVGDNTVRINVVSPDGKTSEYKIKAVRADFYYGENGNNGDKNDTEVPETAPAEENTKSSGGFPGWLAVLLVILALAGGAFGGYFLRAKFPDGVIVAFKKRFGKTKLYK